MVAGAINCIKYLVFIFNLVFFLFGIALIAVGAYVQTQLNEYLNFFNTNVNGPAILLIVVGLVIFVISFFGCCGAIKENYCMVLTFSILMMVILVCQIAGSIAGFVYYKDIKGITQTNLMESINSYKNPNREGVKIVWDKAQMDWTCCGVEGPGDWKSEFPENPPATCCSVNRTSSTKICTYESASKTGCVKAIEDLFSKNVYYVGAVGIAFAMIQISGVVMTICLARTINRRGKRSYIR